MTPALGPRFLLLQAIVLASYVAGTVSGFGVIVLATTLGALLYPLDELLPVLVPTSLALTGVLVVRHRHDVDRALLFRQVLPWMGAGTAIGLALFRVAPAARLRSAFGLVVVGLALHELRRLARRTEGRPLTRRRAVPWFLAGGVVHGLFATGGPPLVYAFGRLGIERRPFRATLAAVWFLLNLGMTASYLAAGRVGPPQARAIALLLPLVPAGLAIGEAVHRRIDERRFRALVLLTLLAAGASLC